MSEPAYTCLSVDERRRQLLQAGAAVFAERTYEEISMRQIAEAAGELQQLIEPTGDGTPIEQFTASLDAYLTWIENNARTWTKLMQSASSLPEARALVAGFRAQTMDLVLAQLTGTSRLARRCAPP